MKRHIGSVAALMCVLAFSSCEDGALEEAGESVDEMADDAGDAAEDMVDEVEDAVDGNH